MRPETRVYLSDALSAIDEIVSIAGADGNTYLDSRRDALAIERLFEILGEALARIGKAEPAVLDLIPDALAIIGMRNVIAHGYDAIDPMRIVSAIRDRAPDLSSVLKKLLS